MSKISTRVVKIMLDEIKAAGSNNSLPQIAKVADIPYQSLDVIDNLNTETTALETANSIACAYGYFLVRIGNELRFVKPTDSPIVLRGEDAALYRYLKEAGLLEPLFLKWVKRFAFDSQRAKALKALFNIVELMGR